MRGEAKPGSIDAGGQRGSQVDPTKGCNREVKGGSTYGLEVVAVVLRGAALL